MTEENIREDLNREPFVPVRLHLVSGKTFDITRQGIAWPLSNRLLVFVNAIDRGVGADTYYIISYQNVERIQPLDAGRRDVGKRKRA